MRHSGWQLTGGVVFYENPVQLVRCRFLGNRTEDALNSIRSQFSLSEVEIADALTLLALQAE